MEQFKLTNQAKAKAIKELKSLRWREKVSGHELTAQGLKLYYKNSIGSWTYNTEINTLTRETEVEPAKGIEADIEDILHDVAHPEEIYFDPNDRNCDSDGDGADSENPDNTEIENEGEEEKMETSNVTPENNSVNDEQVKVLVEQISTQLKTPFQELIAASINSAIDKADLVKKIDEVLSKVSVEKLGISEDSPLIKAIVTAIASIAKVTPEEVVAGETKKEDLHTEEKEEFKTPLKKLSETKPVKVVPPTERKLNEKEIIPCADWNKERFLYPVKFNSVTGVCSLMGYAVGEYFTTQLDFKFKPGIKGRKLKCWLLPEINSNHLYIITDNGDYQMLTLNAETELFEGESIVQVKRENLWNMRRYDKEVNEDKARLQKLKESKVVLSA